MAIKFNLDPAAYTPVGVTFFKKATPEEARREYTRLRRAAEKRLKRLKSAGYESADIYKYREKYPFKKPSELETDRQLESALSDVYRFLQNKRTTISGMKKLEKQWLDTLHEHHYDFVNESNLKQFGDFMEAARMKAGGKLPQSDVIAELYDAAELKNIPREQLLKDFEYWKDNVEQLQESRKSRKQNATASDYRRNIERRKKRYAAEAAGRRKGR